MDHTTQWLIWCLAAFVAAGCSLIVSARLGKPALAGAVAVACGALGAVLVGAMTLDDMWRYPQVPVEKFAIVGAPAGGVTWLLALLVSNRLRSVAPDKLTLISIALFFVSLGVAMAVAVLVMRAHAGILGAALYGAVCAIPTATFAVLYAAAAIIVWCMGRRQHV